MATHTTQTTVEEQIIHLLYTMIQAHNIRDDDAVSLRTLKLMLLGRVLKRFGLNWAEMNILLKTHTPVHAEMVRELQSGGEEDTILAQVFVRNEKLIRLVKAALQNGKNVNKILAVDGLGGPSGLNFDPKHYVGNLRYGSDDNTLFDKGPECRRLHVEAVRKMYDMLEGSPAPERQVYEILRQCFEEMAQVKLPKLEEEEGMDAALREDVSHFYMSVMGDENIRDLVKATCLKRFRGEKRPLTEDECEKQES